MTGNKRERKGFLGRPPTVLLNALTSIQADHERKDSKVPSLLQEMLKKNPKWARDLSKILAMFTKASTTTAPSKLRATISPARTVRAVTRLVRFNAILGTLLTLISTSPEEGLYRPGRIR
ncbi:hypothetical protein BJX63DRAFT_61051 [Aspergillus granulosus]|uniref:Uncharacterized protein n=1 Tax=Aspergillus granulosus TaxID=176169 RepID=A0ABR4GX35_9EURO